MVMRNIICIVFICLTVSAAGQSVFYVQDVAYNANASDSNAGTNIDYPWATWQHAFETADAGDTVYFRGGVWYPTTKPVSGYPITLIAPNSGYGNNGTHDSPIVYMAYPPDYAEGNVPILDCQYASQATTGNIGINIDVAEYLEFHGLTIRNVLMLNTTANVMGIGMTDCTGTMTFKNMVTHNIGGAGQWYRGFDTLYLQNCDSYLCCDSLDVTGAGGDGDGFVISARGVAVDTFKIAYVKGCRAWNVSDDGFDIGSQKQLQIDSCWSWGNGINYYSDAYDGDGYGFKLTASAVMADGKRWLRNCVSAYNEVGFGDVNLHLSPDYGPRMYYFNNTSYGDYLPFMSGPGAFDCETDPAHVVYKNNIAYAYTFGFPANFNSCAGVVPPYIDVETNTFILGSYNIGLPNPTYSLSDADFISLDTLQLSYDRKPDGSLPDIDFGKLAPTSDLIDAGTDVGLDYYGDAPDLGWYEYTPGPQIIADHTVIDDFDYIPQYYIDEVKKMWLSYAGESHSEGIRYGLLALETSDPTYAVSVVESGTPEVYTDANLRASRATWGDLTHSTGWIYDYGEEDWFVSPLALTRTKASLDYCNTTGPELAAFGFGWCWDGNYYAVDSINKYISATQEYIDHAESNDMLTRVFFTTGPVDSYTLGLGYLKYLAYEQIRDSVLADPNRILFDYADILCYDDGSSVPNTRSYNGHIYPWITTTNLGDGGLGHIGPAGRLRLAKAMWWMLARMAGWDGNVTVYSEEEVDSTATDILTFTIASQTGAATINTTNHTVTIEVSYTANVASLTPTLTLSAGATVIPLSGVARDFTNPVPYTVTAEDGVTHQEWTVTVTQEAEPVTPVPTGGSIVKFNGKIVKR